MVFTRTESVRKVVCREEKRKYYRFRSAKYYGGIATADCVGCNLNCAFCWSETPRKHPEKIGTFYSPRDVVRKVESIAREKHYRQIRISGNEPTLCKTHLLKLLDVLPLRFLFILETNGILLNEAYVQELSDYPNLHVRVSLKAGNPRTFSKITGAPKRQFTQPFKALRLLEQYKVSYHPSVVKDTLEQSDLTYIKNALENLNTHLEFETLTFYPHVLTEMKQRGLDKYIGDT